ncbi:MAG: hypothetical protein D6824_06545 [Planctomycetota bacterium]|nr:MAG: hypothetical protein D6824_06545 [Planctomycetota bacterium]
MFDSVAEQGARIAEALSQRTNSGPLATMLLTAGVAVLTLWAVLALRRRLRRRRQSARTPTKPPTASVSQSRVDRQRAEIEQLMVDAEELVRRLAALLDNKAARAEQTLDRLEARLREVERHAALLPSDPASARMRPNSSAPETAAQPTAPASVLETTTAPMDPLREEVVKLAGEGLTPVEIASRLNEQVGKVELILALHNA